MNNDNSPLMKFLLKRTYGEPGENIPRSIDVNYNLKDWPYLIRLIIIMVLVSTIVHMAFEILDYKLSSHRNSKGVTHEYH